MTALQTTPLRFFFDGRKVLQIQRNHHRRQNDDLPDGLVVFGLDLLWNFSNSTRLGWPSESISAALKVHIPAKLHMIYTAVAVDKNFEVQIDGHGDMLIVCHFIILCDKIVSSQMRDLLWLCVLRQVLWEQLYIATLTCWLCRSILLVLAYKACLVVCRHQRFVQGERDRPPSMSFHSQNVLHLGAWW